MSFGYISAFAYLYNGMYGVSTDDNGLYYMRARYYNVSIKRFINQDVVNGSITNSQSLNKFSYVQGNPISLTDPFGLSPNISISGIGHAALDLLGIIPGFDFCDAINAAWYLSEGDYENAALSAVACIPMLGSVVGNGLKWGAKGVANAEKVADTVKLGSRIVGDGGAMLLSGGQAVESAKQVYTNITNGEGLTWKNAVDVITLGISVAGMGMAGASIAKSGKSLNAMYKGETAVSNVATSNATKGVSAAAESASDPYALLEGRAGFKASLSAEERAACDLAGLQMSASKSGRETNAKTLYHYTNEKGMNGIVASQKLNPSLKANNPKDARYGNGQYLSDISPENQTPMGLASRFIHVPNKYKYTHYVEIDVTDLEIIKGRNGVYVIPNDSPLDLIGRIVSTGRVGAN